jgi:hypothetical protein
MELKDFLLLVSEASVKFEAQLFLEQRRRSISAPKILSLMSGTSASSTFKMLCTPTYACRNEKKVPKKESLS